MIVFTKDELIHIATTKSALVAVSSAFSLMTGAVVGFKFAQKRMLTEFDQLLDEETERLKKHYGKVYKADAVTSDPEALVELKYPNSLGVLGYGEPNPDVDLTNLVRKRVKAGGEKAEQEAMERVEAALDEEDDGLYSVDTETDDVRELSVFDYGAELAARSSEEPYVLSHDEYMANEFDYTQVDWTYFAGDGILVDSEERPVEDIRGTVGKENLKKFGHGSGDENIVFVRNEKREIEYEITRSSAKYTTTVGFLEHSDRPGVRKFRSYDD